MNITDTIQLSYENLKRTKVRSVLTALGVIIGIGALVSMVSFGVGMQKNITDMFKKNDLFTSIIVTPVKIDMSGSTNPLAGLVQGPNLPVLHDAAVDSIAGITGVKDVIPEVTVPAVIKIGGRTVKTQIKGVPLTAAGYHPYKDISTGSFFASDTSMTLILSRALCNKLRYKFTRTDKPASLSAADSLRSMVLVNPDTLINKPVEIITSVIDITRIRQSTAAVFSGQYAAPPITQKYTRARIGAILPESSRFSGRYSADAYMPISVVKKIPSLGFTNVWDIIGRSGQDGAGYGSVTVKVDDIRHVESVAARIDSMGFGTMSIINQIDEMKRGFIVFDTILGAIGAVALLVAALGIINTMLMSILERTKEIGIIKAVGGSEHEVKGIFIVEACTIGFIGGILGVALGWVVTKIAGMIMNMYIAHEGGSAVDMFHIPWWLITGSLAFSILVSLVSGLYPASRAARVNPVEALRRE